LASAAARVSRRSGLKSTSDMPTSRHRCAYSCCVARSIVLPLETTQTARWPGPQSSTVVADAVSATIGSDG
jgi:hypothetical protein